MGQSKNIFMLYMPPGNAEAMVHYEDTIRQKVPLDRITAHVERSVARELQILFRDKKVAVWGSRDSASNRQKFDRMKVGDEILIVEGGTIRLLGLVAAKTVSPVLSRELWKNLRGETTVGWDLIYFIANPKEIDLPFVEFCRVIGYQDNLRLRGFTAVADEKIDRFYSQYDDLYSVLVGLKAGREPAPVLDPQILREDPAPEPPQSEADIDEIASEHTQMQWMLLKMGRSAGERVWAPKNDQGRIATAYNFREFEDRFAAGIDTQVKYVENIDVVWKTEFRIDAAFEIENSTSIYSGLLRFADLTMVAPNSTYPLFIVAPKERRGRVQDQLARPVFRHLRMREKVRFLPYEKVREIDDFFRECPKGLSADVIAGKAETFEE